MKVKVLKDTFDRVTRKPLKKGDIVELTEARAEAGVKAGLCEIVKTEKKESKPKKAKAEVKKKK